MNSRFAEYKSLVRCANQVSTRVNGPRWVSHVSQDQNGNHILILNTEANEFSIYEDPISGGGLFFGVRIMYRDDGERITVPITSPGGCLYILKEALKAWFDCELDKAFNEPEDYLKASGGVKMQCCILTLRESIIEFQSLP